MPPSLIYMLDTEFLVKSFFPQGDQGMSTQKWRG